MQRPPLYLYKVSRISYIRNTMSYLYERNRSDRNIFIRRESMGGFFDFEILVTHSIFGVRSS